MISNDFNKVIVSGICDRVPEVSFTKNKFPVTNFNIVSRARDKTQTFCVTAWGKLAEELSDSMICGEKLIVEGELNIKNTESKKSYEICAKRIFSVVEGVTGEFAG